ncbi:asparagine synthase C-terminal domain-containing protein [Haloarchaeobius salinus]|uniref:asparagine synthase C-terminal domain-containing protein n=1 Tax=Haloarchaeobius salinus TaxID=1198298 RepID=UPI00210ACD1A
MTLDGTDATTVRRALETGDPLPGTAGFAGELDGTLVRDVLGRRPLFLDDATDGDDWAFDPTELTAPRSLPAGVRRSADGRETGVWTLPDPEPTTDVDVAVADLQAAIRESAASLPDEDIAVAFSGGVDSALVAALVDGPCYVAGFPDSHDVAAARTAADAMGVDLTVVELTHDAIERAVPEIVQAMGRTNAMDVQISLPLYLVAERVAADGFDHLAVGQGADELFGGYAKVAKAPDDPRVEAGTVRGAVREMVHSLPDQLERDVLSLRGAGVEPVAPLLHDAVVEAALPLSGELLVDDAGTRKRALRLAAREWIPESVADRDKKAVQYGSLASRELDRLARQAGYKRRLDDHVTKYVESLVSGE